MEGVAVTVLPVAAFSAMRRWSVRQGQDDDQPRRASDMVSVDHAHREAAAPPWPNLLAGKASEELPSALKRGSLDSREIAPQGLSGMMSSGLSDFQNFVSGSFASLGGSSSEASGEDSDESEQLQLEEALRSMSKFCEGYSAVRVEPTKAELDAFWLRLRCLDLDSSTISAAICEQLSLGSEADEWQPRLRALHFLEYLLGKLDEATCFEAALETCSESKDIIRHLSEEVPQCRQVAGRVLAAQADAAAQDPADASEKVYLVFNEDLANRTSGLAFRLCKRRKHKDNLVKGPRWGTTVRGVDHGDGWLRVGERFLPMALHGKQVVFEQEEEEAVLGYTAAVDTVNNECKAAAAAPPVHAEGTFEAAFQAESPAPQGGQALSGLEGLSFAQEAVDKEGLAALPESQIPALSKPAWITESQQRYLWLSAVDTAIEKQPDPFAFAGYHAFDHNGMDAGFDHNGMVHAL